MRLRSFLAAATVTLLTRPSFGQQSGATGSLERFQPSPAGDTLLGVTSPGAAGHLVLRAKAVIDAAYRPLSIQDGSTRTSIVSRQMFLHVDASLSLFDRLLFSVDMPFALGQAGDSPSIAGVRFASPDVAQVGDLRLGARVRIFGGPWDPLQIGAGGYIFVPTAPAASYAGDGAVRGEPHLLIGGRYQRFVYGASLGTTLHASTRPHTFDFRVGAGVVFADERFQIGPELSLATPFSNELVVSTKDTTISIAAPTSAELLLGVKLRPLRFLVFSVGAGPGLTQGWGTPTFFAVGSVGYEPLPPRPRAKDTPKDDAPAPSPAAADHAARTPDAPVLGPDGDGDGIPDASDACPKVPGVKSDDPAKNGCPLDTDGDGIPDAEDACPTQRGGPDPDPKKNGCSHVTVTRTEIVITRQVQFRVAQASLDQTVDPVSDDLLTEVRDAIVEHPEIQLIEVQGHADNTGPEDYNQRLSQGRAEAVRLWLIRRRIPPTKLVARGYGSAVPVASNDSEQGRQANRRVQFVIVPKKP